MKNNVFDLTQISYHYDGYYLDSVGDIWSAKTGIIRRLYQGTYGDYFLSYGGERFRVSRTDIKNIMNSEAFKDWNACFGSEPVTDAGTKIAANVDVTSKPIQDFMIVSDETPPAIYLYQSSKEQVKSQAEQFARDNPGVRFTVAEIKGSVIASNVEWN